MANTWIFQANPTRFDIDGFLATDPPTMRWTVRQGEKQMRPGDTVFLWRAIGDGDPKLSGVVAQAEIVAPPALQPDMPAALPFWQDAAEATDQLRADLRLGRIALRDRLKRSWLLEDPVLRGMAILTRRTGTNFLLDLAQADRLGAVWRRAGVDWDYAEALAGLWAYWKTLGANVSRLPGNPVSDVALRTGRVVPGAYNKVMNYRAIDPGDARAGLSAASVQDRAVWAAFYNSAAGTLDGVALEAEYQRLWGADTGVIAASQEPVENTARRLAQRSLADLMAKYMARVPALPAKPKPRVAAQRLFDREPLVVAIARLRAQWACEVPGCAHPLFTDENGMPFVEVHHIVPLAAGGSDRIENVACVCPSHHREAHHGKAASTIAVALAQVRNAE
jgi:hypothetical protein